MNEKVERLIQLYEKNPLVEKDNGDPFFYQKPLPDIINEEGKLTASLFEYTQKQLFGHISYIAGEQDRLHFEVFDSSRPETLFLKCNDAGSKEIEREELRRLLSLSVKSKEKCIYAQLTSVRYKKAVEIAERQLTMLNTMNSFDITDNQLAESIEICCKETNACQNKLGSSYGSELMVLLQKLPLVNYSKAIQSDYNLKLLRQYYFISKQNEVIEQLLMQYAHNYFLTLLYEMEFKVQTEIHHTISSLKSLLSREVKSMETRIALLNLMVCDVKQEKQITSHYDMKGIYEASQSNKKDTEMYRNLNGTVSELGRAPKLNKKELEDVELQISELNKQIQSMLKNAEQLMRSAMEKSNEELPILVANVEEKLSMATIRINQVIKDFTEKQRLLTVDRKEEVNRRIFTDFMNNPGKLKRSLKYLIARVNSAFVSTL